MENSKKLLVKPSVVPIGSKDYIFKTRDINCIKYCMNLRIENIEEYNYNTREPINSIDFTINSLKIYKNKFLN